MKNAVKRSAHEEWDMRFGNALEAAQSGLRIARSGWNGKGMWLAYMPAMDVSEDKVTERVKKFIPDGGLRVGSYMVMKTADGTWQPGWLASQMDMDANDWKVLAPAVPQPHPDSLRDLVK